MGAPVPLDILAKISYIQAMIINIITILAIILLILLLIYSIIFITKELIQMFNKN